MVISRFAPSPTGDLHIGGIRTALYAWLFARQQNGKFILRIEDTDEQRSTQDSTDGIIAGMQWLGLNYDEGPIFQSQRYDRYTEVIQGLLSSGSAYKCYCSKERLEQLREAQMLKKAKPKYDGYCRFHDINESNPNLPYVVRFASPQSGEVHFVDRIRGELKVNNEELDDLILARPDGSPTYNLSVVVDDWDMKVSMVIRGDDHINNTYRQINIFKALDAKPPQYAHVSSILGADGKKLSKRHGAASVLAYRDLGILPQALFNALVRLGWAHGDQELFSLQELIRLFKIEEVHKSPAVFDVQKLLWFNQQYLKSLNNDEIIIHLTRFLDLLAVNYQGDGGNNNPKLADVVAVLKIRCKTLQEMAEKAACFYLDSVNYDSDAVAKYFHNKSLAVLEQVIKSCNNLTDWNSESLHAMLDKIMADLNIKMPELAQPIRIALTGNINSPPINETLALMPKKIVLERLNSAVTYINSMN